ncbi:NAD(P)H-dependent oxidoreductase [Pedobacter sp. AW31-3R]|uniref:NAD(P)H-dependent oxidoreductase n=1 Tax=Pedobacter sp. AW31-3R TaxID=3445781 RepID=UPI003F9F8447
MKKVLLINTHLTYPNWSEGKLNNAFQQIAKEFFTTMGYLVEETRVEKGYNVDEEVAKHLETNIIILQTPVNWFGAPWIYKKYVDEVFNYGLHSRKFLSGDGRTKADPSRQYGTGGHLQDKRFMVCATWNAPVEAFNDKKQLLFEGRSTADFFIQITSNYRFCGVEVVADYNSFDIFKDEDASADLANYPAHLERVFGL